MRVPCITQTTAAILMWETIHNRPNTGQGGIAAQLQGHWWGSRGAHPSSLSVTSRGHLHCRSHCLWQPCMLTSRLLPLITLPGMAEEMHRDSVLKPDICRETCNHRAISCAMECRYLTRIGTLTTL